MKKENLKRKFKALSLCFYLLLLICTTSSSGFSQDLLKMIPSNATGVATMNGASFFKKIDLDQINRLEMFQELDEQNKGKKGSKYEAYSKIYKDPASIGLNLYAKSYIYFENSPDTNMYGSSYTYSGMFISLTSNKKFESFIKKVSDSSIVKKGNYKLCNIGYNDMVAWSKNHMILLTVSGYYGYDDEGKKDLMLMKKFEELTTLPSERCIKGNKNFLTSQNETFDFAYWMNFGSFFNGLGLMTAPMFIYKDIPFIGTDFYKDYYLQLSLSFNKGNITMDAKQFLSEESAKKIESVYGKGLNPDFMKYIQKDNLLGLWSYSLNMKGIKAILDTSLTDSIKNNMNHSFMELLYESQIKKDQTIKKMQAEVDSMYTDLYKPDTAAAMPYYEDVDYYSDTTAADQPYYEDNYYDTTSVIVDTAYTSEDDYMYDTTESALSDYNYDYNYNTKEDSIYNIKNAKISDKQAEIQKRKEELLDQKMKGVNMGKDDLFDLFEGDIMAAITDYYLIEKKYTSYEYDDEELKPIEVEKTRKEQFPEYLAGLTLNNLTKANNILKHLEKDSFLIKHGNFYMIPGENKFYIAITGKLLLITNNENLLKNNFDGYKNEERIAKDIQDQILNKTSSLYVNLRDIFSKMPTESSSANTLAIYSLLANSLKNLSVASNQYSGDVSDSELLFNLTNKIDNSFYDIFRIANEIYKIEKQR